MTVDIYKPIRIGGLEVSGLQTLSPDIEADLLKRGVAKLIAPQQNDEEHYSAARALADEILLSARAKKGLRKSIYCRKAATGAANGTSWRDAFTTLETAAAALTSDCILYLDSTEANPFTVMSAANTATLERVEVITDAGPNAGTWITGRITGTWTDQGGGIFRTALATAPLAASWDYKRDDAAGTVTGIDLTQPDIAAALSEWGATPADCVAWYGFLEKEASGTTTPALGKWSHTGGYLYIYPPGSPILADVQTKAAWCTANSGLHFTGRCSDWYIRGGLTVNHTPANSAASGYSVKFSSGSRVVVSGVRSIMSGYHGVCFDGSSGVDNVIFDCKFIGYVKGGVPITFYSATTKTDANAKADKIVALCFGLLKTTGAPIDTDHAARVGYSHSGVGEVMAGITYSRILQLDFVGQQEAKFTITLSGGTTGYGGFVNAANHSAGHDVLVDNTWKVRVYDSKALGKAAFMQPEIMWDGCTIDRLGYGDNTDYIFSASTVVDGDATNNFLYRNCTFRLGDHGNFITNFSGSGNLDKMFLDGCDILISGTAALSVFVAVAIESAGSIIMRNNRFAAASADKGIFSVISAKWSTWDKNFVSMGGNTYQAATMTKPVWISTGGSSKTLAEWLAGTDPQNMDRQA